MNPLGSAERRIRLRARGGDGTVAQRVQRWIDVTPSQFTHEAEGLNLVRSLLPGNAPFRAWSNFLAGPVPALKAPPLDFVLPGRDGREPRGQGSGEVRMAPPSMKKIMSMTLARLYRRWVGCPVRKSRVGIRWRSMIPACSW
jgi:hypothetical protein